MLIVQKSAAKVQFFYLPHIYYDTLCIPFYCFLTVKTQFQR